MSTTLSAGPVIDPIVRAREIFERYRRSVEHYSKTFLIPGAEPDDVRQEALIALWKIAQEAPDQPIENLEPLVIFRVRQRLAQVYETQRRFKRRILTESVTTGFDPVTGEVFDIVGRIESPANLLGRDPLDVLIDKEFFDHLCHCLKQLTAYELAGLSRVLKDGYHPDVCSVNGAHGARRKLRKHLRKAGMLTPKDTADRPDRRARVAALKARGWSNSAIARNLRTSLGTVRRDLRLSEGLVA